MNGPDDHELEQFAQRFEAARPELSDEAMGRIEAALHREIGQAATRRNVRRLVAAAVGLAACVLVAIGLSVLPGGNDAAVRDGAAVADGSTKGEQAEEPKLEQPPEPPPAVAEMIEDRFEVALSIPHSTAAPPGPLVSLEQYQSLIGDMP